MTKVQTLAEIVSGVNAYLAETGSRVYGDGTSFCLTGGIRVDPVAGKVSFHGHVAGRDGTGYGSGFLFDPKKVVTPAALGKVAELAGGHYEVTGSETYIAIHAGGLSPAALAAQEEAAHGLPMLKGVEYSL